MNKILRFLFPFFILIILCCSGLQNPFDSKSSNYISDSSFIREYDSLHIDTSVVFDTLIHIDTVVHDSFYIITKVNYDTSFIIDTFYFKDTIHHYDTSFLIDTIHHYDTSFLIDTIIFKDTIVDTSHLFDTVHFLDTLYHYDTIFHRDTIIDTVMFYTAQPFIYLVKLPDSSLFNTFDYGSTYSLLFKCSGINPSIIRGYSFMPEGGTVWNNITLPWSRTFNLTTSELLTLRIITDSGSFANTFVVRCNPTIRNSFPVFKKAKIYNLSDIFERTYENSFPICTLWTDSIPFSTKPDCISLLQINVTFSLPGSTRFEYYASENGSYDILSCLSYEDSPSFGYLFESQDLLPGIHPFTIKCRSISPDTSLWSPWCTMVFVVLDGR